jgi:uncharacterized protein (TIGR02246 family)
MEIRLVVAAVWLAISFALRAFAQQQETVDPKIAEEIRALAAKYDDAFNKNDVAAVSAFITEDAIWKTPHGTLTGRQAIEKDFDNEFRRYHLNNLSTKFDQIDALGNDVEAIGTWSLAFQWNGDTKHVKGHASWVLVRDGDGWKIRADTYDESAPY